MIQKLLIANRGEIALRILRAAQELQIATVAVYSTADAHALYVELADEAYCIGEAPSQKSYLNKNALLTIAERTGCDAIHPGYGFLSEDADFIRQVEEAGLIFVGPSAHIVSMMGDKIAARRLMQDHGVPVVPGSEGDLHTLDEALALAEQFGYPVLLKAAAGGGGKGMRLVEDASMMHDAFLSAKAEAKAAFGNDALYLEKYIVSPKHIEVQVLADANGRIAVFPERNCSVQRKHQKMIEETPSVNLSEETRTRLMEVATLATKACGYVNAGTIEFVMDANEAFYFIEMNTRIQVEHPITEMITGVDLVKEQLRIASQLPMGIPEGMVPSKGYALECRITAEDPLAHFAPQCGRLDFLHVPGGMGLRFDSHLYVGAEITPFYDAMIGKIIVQDQTRMGAIRKMRRAIEEMTIGGIRTNLYLQYAILHDPEFVRGRYDTSFIEKKLPSLLALMETYAQ